MDDDTPDPGGLDDEDGVVFYGETEELAFFSVGFFTEQDVPLIGTSNSIEFGIIYSVPPDRNGWINAWIDFNRDGDWNDTGEQIVTDFPVRKGSNIFPTHRRFTYTISPNTELDAGYTFARFRISRFTRIIAGIALADGETEDYLVKIQVPMDFGDAPEVDEEYNYPTTLATNGARHLPMDLGPNLGEKIDFENDGAPEDVALGDDVEDEELTDDEDGVLFFTNFEPGELAAMVVFASKTAKLDAWVDYNGDGDWDDDGEKIFDSIDLVEDENLLAVTVPLDAVVGPTYARFRISSNGNLEPFGLAQDGEVEDYLVEVGETFLRWEEVRRDGDQLYLRWFGRGNLEGSDNLADPWEELENERNDFWYTIDGSRQFFRIVDK